MKYKLPIVSLVLAAGFAAWVAADSLPDLNPAKPAASSALPDSHQEWSGNDLLERSAAEVYRLANVSGQVRQRTQLFGRKLASAGRFRQWNDGQALRFRWDLRTQIGDASAHLLFMGDGRFVWIRRQLPRKRSLQRIDWEVVQARIREEARRGRAPAIDASAVVAYGLSGILSRLAAHFDFEPPQPSEIGSERIPVLTLVGRWKPESLATYYPQAADDVQKGKLKQLPEPVPTHVELVLGNDDILPYFPYRISFLRKSRDGTIRLMDMEFFELTQNSPIDPADFRYDPGSQPVEDVTEAAVAQLFPSASE